MLVVLVLRKGKHTDLLLFQGTILIACDEKDCQKTGWNEKRHKADCKMLKDADLRGLLGLQWTKSDTRVSFPSVAIS
jgi:hypothetical protein